MQETVLKSLELLGAAIDPDNHVHACYPRTFWRRGQARYDHVLRRNIFETSRISEEKVVMVASVRIEVEPRTVHHDLAQQPGIGELMQRVVYGGQRDAYVRSNRFFVHGLCRDMAIALLE